MSAKWHAPGMGEVHSEDDKVIIQCIREGDDKVELACDETAQMVCKKLNAPTWHKVEDLLPVEGKYVLLYDEKLKDFGYFIGYLYYDPHKIFKDVDGEEIGDQITHWKPLPEFKEES